MHPQTIDFHDWWLKTFKGIKGSTLTQFVEMYPDKKSYSDLSNEIMKFTFPEPGAMEGVKSRSEVAPSTRKKWSEGVEFDLLFLLLFLFRASSDRQGAPYRS